MTDRTFDYGGAPVHQTWYDPSSPNTLSQRLIEAIATVEETPPTDLPPLHDAIDLDLLTRFVEHATTAPRTPSVSIGVALEAWTIHVHSDGQILVYEPEDDVSARVDAVLPTRDAADD